MDEGTCCRCGETKPAAAFAKDASKAAGRKSLCKACDNARCKAYYEANRERKRAAYVSKVKPRECETCSGAYIPTSGRQRFCSPSCKPTKPASGATLEIPCAHCGKPKTTRARDHARWTATYCDRSCAGKARERKPRKKRTRTKKQGLPVVRGRCCVSIKRKPKTRTFLGICCAECGTTFVAQSFERPLCSECATRLARRAAKDRRRARKRNAYVEHVYRRKVYDRDNWTCRICGKPVDADAQVPDPNAPTLDHILPFALGGRHEYINVQTAHFLCNSRKGANVTQLAFAA